MAVDKFRGSVTAHQACAALTEGIQSAAPGVEVVAVPMADGGEGTLDAALDAGFARRTRAVKDPLGATIHADWGLRQVNGRREGLIEAALAVGLDLVSSERQDPLSAASTGVGQLITAALDAGVARLTLAVGGTACTDGGTGMLTALGARFLDENGNDLAAGGAALNSLARVDLSALDRRLASCEVLVATDVDNPLTGETGAARMFAPQKGATPAEVETLERGMKRLAEILQRSSDDVYASPHLSSVTPGAGAGGGLGFAAMMAFGARRISGGGLVKDLVRLDDVLSGALFVVTGEGCLDTQSLGGKTPLVVSRMATELGVPAVAVCGVNRLTPAQGTDAGFCDILSVSDRAKDLHESMSRAPEILTAIGASIASDLLGSEI